jgi:GNAT superfamily N-acetyltransferase
VGHTIVRVEDGGGLFSTTYVDPPARGLGVAAALLARGEAWMRERRLPLARTYTDRRNAKLIALYQGRGYGLAAGPDDFVILSKEL